MTLSLGDYAAFLPGDLGIYSMHQTLAEAQAMADKLTLERGKPYAAGLFDDWWNAKSKSYLDNGPLTEISAERYDEMLGVLPPMYRTGALGFFICEMLSASITAVNSIAKQWTFATARHGSHQKQSKR